MNISLKLHNLMKKKESELNALYKIEKNRDNIAIIYKNGRAVHSKYNVNNECKRALENINKNKNLLIIYGYGLGYILKYLLENIDNYFDENIIKTLKIIVVVEDAAIFKYSYYNIYNTDNKNIFFIYKNDDINYINKLADYKSINGINIVILPSLTKEEKDNANIFYKEILNIAEKEISNIFTNMYFENIWTKNIIFNSEYINKSSDILNFKNAFKGLKALLICPGPTLKHSIDIIKKQRENLIIICADTSYSILCKHNIIPDFVVTVDGGFFNSLDFVYENKKFPYLIMDMCANKIIPKNINADIIRFKSNSDLGLAEYISKFITLSHLSTSNTVATTMIDFAYYLGLDEVLLIGFDNSYPFYERHIKHALSYEYMINKTNKLKTYESYYFNAIRNNTNIENYPPTEFVFESQIEYFKEFKNKYSNMKIKRITKEAVKIASIEEGNIDDLVKNNIREEALKKAKKIYKVEDNNTNIKEAYTELKNILEEFRDILSNAYNNINNCNMEDIDNIYNNTINLIKEYQEKAGILKTILSATIIMCERGERNKKEKLIFLLLESLRNVNYFFTRVSLIINKL
ncbi:6-hydroxymethylpterin diphosphokinase MptE-like protein [uncultured Brachyspira sp.]|uniref:motility associated factor glycosyltransferase family protein n=1 Tax=uncultured Brachyspira sp. TaxID=221953 RepID=UPI00341BF7E3